MPTSIKMQYLGWPILFGVQMRIIPDPKAGIKCHVTDLTNSPIAAKTDWDNSPVFEVAGINNQLYLLTVLLFL